MSAGRITWAAGLAVLLACPSGEVRAQAASAGTLTQPPDDGVVSQEWHGLGPRYSYWGWSGPHRAGPGYYPVYIRTGDRELHQSFHTGRATERYRQNVFELRRKLERRLGYTYRGRWDRSLLGLNDPPGLTDRRARICDGPWWREYLDGSLMDSVYRQGHELEYHRQQELYLREQLTLLSHRDLLDRGLDLFRQGSYGQAARAFAAAAEKNHEDAASRIHAAQSLMAVGMYEQAMMHVRRAFELQPLLMQLPMDLASDYADRTDYRKQLGRLATHVEAHPQDREAAVLLAYERFFSADPRTASKAIKRIRPLAKSDGFVRKLLAAAAPIVPEARQRQGNPHPARVEP